MCKQLVFSRRRCLIQALNSAWVVSLVIFFAVVSARAQTSSVILGTVKDASGASVAGAAVTVLNVDTAQARSTMSGEDGAYRIPALQAGHYSVKIEKEGFKTSTQTGITLDVAQELNASVSLEVGSSAQEVVVTGEAPQVDTSTSTLGGLVNDEKVAELPLNGRNYIDLSLMQTGVTKNQNTGQAGNMIGTTFSANGAPIISNNFLLDGTSIVNPSGWGPGSMAGTTLGVDGVKEYKVITSAFSAEYGMTMGSQMVLVSKGGTNQFHGDAFEYLRNNVMDARNFFDYGYLTTGKRDPLYQRNNFGGAFGGPIRKDKTFFFVVYEGVRQNQGVTVLDTMPSQGCLNAAATGTVTSTQCSLIAAGAGGAVTTVKVNSISAPLLQLFPNPAPAANAANNYTFPSAALTNVSYGQIRVDHNFSAADSMFARYTVDNSDINGPFANPQAFTGTALPQERFQDGSRDQFLTLSENHIFSPTVLNSVRLSYSRSGYNYLPQKVNNIPGLPIVSAGYPDFGVLNITGLTSTTVAPNQLNFHLQNIYSLADDLYYTRDKHALKFGFLGNRFESAVSSPNGYGQEYFSSFANFLLAQPNRINVTTSTSNENRDFRYFTMGFYAQDDWRATSRLTINMGVRYEFNTTPRELNGRDYTLRNHALDPTPTQGAIMLDRSYLNFSPRVGFAWDVFGDGKTSIRGAAGLYYDVGNFGNLFILNAFAGLVEVNVQQFLNPSSNIAVPLPYTQSSPATTIQGISDYNDSQPHFLQMNLSVQRQLPWNTALTVAYVSTRGAHLWSTGEGNNTTPTFVDANGIQYWSNNLSSTTTGCENVVPSCRANPAYDNIQLTSTLGDSWYNALQVNVNKRLGHGLEFQSSYTWAHSEDTTEGNLGVTTCSGVGMDQSSDPLHRIRDKAPSCFDVRNNVRFNLLYHLPGIGSTGFVSKLTNGWWMGNIVSVLGGYPFTPINGINRSNSGVFYNAPNERVNLGTATVAPGAIGPDGNVNLTSKTFIPYDAGSVITGNPNQWFNPLMFTLQPMVPCPNIPSQTCGTLGTASRGQLRGPGLGNWDFSLVKDTALRFLGEGGSLQFRAEFFNLLNRANFGTPNPTVFSGTIGTIGLSPTGCTTTCANVGAYSQTPVGTAGAISTTATPSRQVQLALKFIF